SGTRGARNLAPAQLLHERAARDASAWLPVPSRRARDEPRRDREPRSRCARSARHRPRLQGHGARVAGRIGAHRDRFRHAAEWAANLPRALPQPRARGRRHDAARESRLMARVQRVLLVGGGHSHVEVLRRAALAPDARIALTLVTPDAAMLYSA